MTDLPRDERPRKKWKLEPTRTLDDMLQESHEKKAKKKGIRCPKCNCADWRVYSTRRGKGRIQRKRVCRHCGKEVLTFETMDAKD